MSYQGLLDDLDAWATVQPKAAKAIRELLAENERLREDNNQLLGALRELRGALQELRIWLHSAGRRPEECHSMSVIDDALKATRP